MELMRVARAHLEELVGSTSADLRPMALGLSHSLSRYKLKFSADKVDTMIVQAIGLLDDLDKQLNIYAMRVREWYGWHFPEMVKVVTDTILYAKVVKKVGFREAIAAMDLSGLLEEEMEAELKELATAELGIDSPADLLQRVQASALVCAWQSARSLKTGGRSSRASSTPGRTRSRYHLPTTRPCGRPSSSAGGRWKRARSRRGPVKEAHRGARGERHARRDVNGGLLHGRGRARRARAGVAQGGLAPAPVSYTHLTLPTTPYV